MCPILLSYHSLRLPTRPSSSERALLHSCPPCQVCRFARRLAPTTSRSRNGAAARLGSIMDAIGVPKRRFIVSNPDGLAPARRRVFGRHDRRADPDSRRRALQAARDRRPHLRRAHPRHGRPRHDDRRHRRRRRRRHRRASPRPPSCAAYRSSRCRRRCWRRWTARSAARSASITPLGKNLIGAFHQPAAVVVDPELLVDAAAPRVPRRPLRGRQVRRHRQPAAVRARARRSAGALRARPGRARAGHRRVAAGSRRRSSRRTSANPGRGGR